MIALKNCCREDNILELYNWIFQTEGEEKYILYFYVESKHERTNPICELCTIYNSHIINAILQ